MKYIIFIILLVLCFSCTKSFDMKSYDTANIENYNLIVENIEVLGDMISYDALSDSATISQFNLQGNELKNKVENSIQILENSEVPSELEQYQNSLLNIYKLYLDLIKHDLLFSNLDKDNLGFKIDSFAYVHDKMNETIVMSTDSFNVLRDDLINPIYITGNE